MKLRPLAILIFAAPLIAVGCAVQGLPFEKVQSSANEAVIYVYRPYSYAGSLLRPSVTCGDEWARISPGGYHAFIVPAGHVTCTVHAETVDAVELNAQPRAYYIKEEIGWGVLTGHPHLNPIDADKSQLEIHSCCVREQ
jgi:hypothetical protein